LVLLRGVIVTAGTQTMQGSFKKFFKNMPDRNRP
jgi:hypothetical protein